MKFYEFIALESYPDPFFVGFHKFHPMKNPAAAFGCWQSLRQTHLASPPLATGDLKKYVGLDGWIHGISN